MAAIPGNSRLKEVGRSDQHVSTCLHNVRHRIHSVLIPGAIIAGLPAICSPGHAMPGRPPAAITPLFHLSFTSEHMFHMLS